jgi:hypothetical protein
LPCLSRFGGRGRPEFPALQHHATELETGLAQTVHRLGASLGREPDALQAQLSDMAPIPGIADPDAIAVQIPAGDLA